MIPTLILFGLVFGHWWRSALITATVAWPVLLLATDVIEVDSRLLGMLLGAAGYAVINTGVGVAIHQGVRWVVRRVRSR